MTITVNRTWQRAIQRAIREGLKATRCIDGTYRVRSVSHPGTHHIVTMDNAGRIDHCTDCLGWENGGRQRPCKHAGAVALAGANVTLEADPWNVPETDIQSNTTRSQLFREVA